MIGWLARLFSPPPPRWIRSRFATVCGECGRDLPEGSRVLWVKGRGVYCAECLHGA